MRKGRRSNALAWGAALGCALSASSARASLAPGEAEQVRHEVSSAQNVGVVRALVARPDLTAAESAAAMASAMTVTRLDAPHAAFLHELVFGAASAASRPTLAVAAVHGVLARADVLLGQHQADLDRSGDALAELARAYELVEDVVTAGPEANVPDSARAECARALVDHVARHPAVLRPDVAVAPEVAAVRAQAALALVDALPDTPSRRVDVADALGLAGARRTLLVDRGVLVLDTGGSDARVSAVRGLLERLPGAAAGTEAVVVAEGARRLRARQGTVVAIDPSAGEANGLDRGQDDASPWGNEAAAPAVDATTMALARALGAAAVRRAIDRSPALGARIERDGGETGVGTVAAMLALDAPRTLDVAAARLLVGKRETAAWVSDALGALAELAPAARGPGGASLSLGRGGGGTAEVARATRLVRDASGAVTALRVDGHAWRFGRDDRGVVTGLWRDSAPVSAKMLGGARPPVSESSSWTGGGLVFARLAGSPRAALTTGPNVWLLGSSAVDAVASPAPGDDVAVDTDVRVDGGPAGLVARALPGSVGAFGAFKGVSLVLLPGAPARAVLFVADGSGAEKAATPAVDLAGGPTQHVHLVVKGTKVEATIGKKTLEATLPAGFEHGDVALRASRGATIEASGFKVKKL